MAASHVSEDALYIEIGLLSNDEHWKCIFPGAHDLIFPVFKKKVYRERNLIATKFVHV